MPTKLISCLLIASFFLSFGCHNTQELTSADITTKKRADFKSECEPYNVTVRTSSPGAYKFLKDNFRINGDTLTGFGTHSVDGKETPWRGSIALSEMNSIKTEEFSTAKTVLIIVIPVAAIATLLFLWAEAMSSI